MEKVNIAVLMGGVSGEREVSLNSGKEVISGLSIIAGYSPVGIDVDKDGKWISELISSRPDVVYIALHGKYGEDGTVQGVLELLGIPYVGSGVLSSALAMDKRKTATLLDSLGLPQPEIEHVITKQSPAPKIVNYPLVVKPNQSGSSLGVTICRESAELEEAVKTAFEQDDVVLLQEFISGRELTCGVLEHNGLTALPVTEIVANVGKFYDYKSKYQAGGSTHIVPAQISDEITKEVQELAKSTFLALDCRDYARVDYILVGKNKIYVLEINTLPGMTSQSLFPEAALKIGISFPELLKILITNAVNRGRNA